MKKNLVALAALAAAGSMATTGREDSNLFTNFNGVAGAMRGLRISSSSLNSGGRSTSKRGFASMDPARVREIASLGGKTAHARGTAHEFTSQEAREASKRRYKKGVTASGAAAR